MAANVDPGQTAIYWEVRSLSKLFTRHICPNKYKILIIISFPKNY